MPGRNLIETFSQLQFLFPGDSNLCHIDKIVTRAHVFLFLEYSPE